MHRAVSLLALLLLTVAPPLSTQAPAPARVALTLERVADGVYATVFANAVDAASNGNGVVIVNDSDVVVVDTQDTPETARTVIAAIRAITPRPVRYVITTHFHGDHQFGNQVYREAYPGVEFISHPNTRADLIAEEVPALSSYVQAGLPQEIARYRDRLTSGKSSAGTPLTPEQRQQLRDAIAADEWLLRELREVHPIPATMTVADSLVLHRGARDIVVRFLGRGNTRGDLVVHLPRERVIVTGDLLVSPMPYAVGSFIEDWIVTLDALQTLPADVIVPGHGAVQHDTRYVRLVQTLLRSTRDQVRAAVARGLDLESTRRAVNLDSLRAEFTNGDARRAFVFDANFTRPAVERAWHEAQAGPSDKRR